MAPLTQHLRSAPINAFDGCAALQSDPCHIQPVQSFPDFGQFRPSRVIVDTSRQLNHTLKSTARRESPNKNAGAGSTASTSSYSFCSSSHPSSTSFSPSLPSPMRVFHPSSIGLVSTRYKMEEQSRARRVALGFDERADRQRRLRQLALDKQRNETVLRQSEDAYHEDREQQAALRQREREDAEAESAFAKTRAAQEAQARDRRAAQRQEQEDEEEEEVEAEEGEDAPLSARSTYSDITSEFFSTRSESPRVSLRRSFQNRSLSVQNSPRQSSFSSSSSSSSRNCKSSSHQALDRKKTSTQKEEDDCKRNSGSSATSDAEIDDESSVKSRDHEIDDASSVKSRDHVSESDEENSSDISSINLDLSPDHWLQATRRRSVNSSTTSSSLRRPSTAHNHSSLQLSSHRASLARQRLMATTSSNESFSQRPSTAHARSDQGWSKSIKMQEPEYQRSIFTQSYEPGLFQHFHAKELPGHVLNPCYEQKMQQRDKESRRRRKLERERIFASLKPFAFTASTALAQRRQASNDNQESDASSDDSSSEYTSGSSSDSDNESNSSRSCSHSRSHSSLRVNRSRSQKSKRPSTARPASSSDASSRRDRVEQFLKFRAREVPESSKGELYQQVMEQRDLEREENKRARAKNLLENSALPPRMAQHEQDRKELEAQQRIEAAEQRRIARAEKESKVCSVPDFRSLQRRFESALQKRKLNRPVTTPQPFNISDMKPKSSSRVRDESSSSEDNDDDGASDSRNQTSGGTSNNSSRASARAPTHDELMIERARQRHEAKKIEKEARARLELEEEEKRQQQEQERLAPQLRALHKQQASLRRQGRASIKEADERWIQQVEAMNEKVRAQKPLYAQKYNAVEARVKTRRNCLLAIAESLERAGIPKHLRSSYFDSDELRDLDLDLGFS